MYLVSVVLLIFWKLVLFSFIRTFSELIAFLHYIYLQWTYCCRILGSWATTGFDSSEHRVESSRVGSRRYATQTQCSGKRVDAVGFTSARSVNKRVEMCLFQFYLRGLLVINFWCCFRSLIHYSSVIKLSFLQKRMGRLSERTYHYNAKLFIWCVPFGVVEKGILS